MNAEPAELQRVQHVTVSRALVEEWCAGSAEHGSTVPPPPVLGGSPGHICCVAVKLSAAENELNPPTLRAPPQHGHVPWFTPPR